MRDLLKTVTYGCMHFCVAVAVAFAISGDWRVALGIGLIEPLVQTAFYVLHERVWRRIPERWALWARRFSDRRPAATLRRHLSPGLRMAK